MSLLKIEDSLDGYIFPFEGNPHRGTIVCLPYRNDTWREDSLPALDNFYELVDTELYTNDMGLNLSVNSGMDLYL